jgi:protein-S-isoprenylcysteine O-methyltransferase Ste14
MPAIIVFASWAAFVVIWAIAALFVKRTVQRRWDLGRLLMLIAGTLAYWTARDPGVLGTLQLWLPTPRTEWLSAAVVLFGLGVNAWARFAIGSNWSGAVSLKQDHELIERGPYRYVRHPIYTGILLMALGTATLHAWASSFVLCAVLFVGLWLKLRAEERLLTEHFPEAYPRYRERVRALIPFVL